MENSTFRLRLKHLLRTEEISLTEFAKTIQKTPQATRGYVNQGVMPKVDVILNIAKCYPHWSLKYLLTGEGPQYNEEVANGTFSPTNQREITLGWLEFRDRIQSDIKILPADGLHYVCQELTQKVGELLEENEGLLLHLEMLATQLTRTD